MFLYIALFFNLTNAKATKKETKSQNARKKNNFFTWLFSQKDHKRQQPNAQDTPRAKALNKAYYNNMRLLQQITNFLQGVNLYSIIKERHPQKANACL